MAFSLDTVKEQALALADEDRAISIDALMESLEETVETPSNLTTLWVQEARRRDREIDEGLVTCKTAGTVMQEIFEKLSRKNA